MASGRSDDLRWRNGDFPGLSDEEEDFFAGFTVEEIGQMRQDRQRRRQQELLRDVDEEIDALIDQEPQESASNSDVEVFTDGGDEESGKSSDEETASNTDSDDAPPNPLQWSNTLGGINVEEFSVRHPKILGTMRRPKISSTFSSTMNSLMKLSGTTLPMRVPRVTQHS